MAGDAVTTPEELRALVDEAERGGVIPQAQEELLHNVFDFADQEARDLMVAAPDVVWLHAGEPVQEALDQALQSGRSRFPVGDGSLDRVIGIAHLRDLALAVRRGAPRAVEDLARPVLLVPETKDVGALLRELREGRQTLAVVADEYGGTAGILTVEDIVEEIVGEIEDEFELPDGTVTRLDDRTVEVAGSMSIDDVNEEVGTALPQEGARTVAGLVFDRLGRRPAPGDEVRVGGTELRVAEVDGVRITRVVIRLRVTPGEEKTDDDGPRRDVRDAARAGDDHDVRQPRLDRAADAGRLPRRLPLRARPPGDRRRRHGRRLRAGQRAVRRTSTSTPRPASATGWARSSTRRPTSRRSSSPPASRRAR